MEIVPTTAIAAIVILVILLASPPRAVVALLAVTPLGAAAAFNLPALGNATILIADVAALALFSIVVLRFGPARTIGTLRPYGPGFFMLALLVYAFVATLFLPRVFAGAFEVFSIGRVEGQLGIVSRPLDPGAGNVTQLFRLVLGGLTFVALATLLRLRPSGNIVLGALVAATLVHVTMGLLDVATYATGTVELLEPLRTANYTILFKHEISGIKRMIGGFPEASSFGFYSMGICAFWLTYWLRGGAMRWSGWFALASVFLVLRSLSSSAYVAFAALLIILLALAAPAIVARAPSRRLVTVGFCGAAALVLALLSLALAYELVPSVQGYLDRLIFDKLDSDSGVERMSWNRQALSNFLDTSLLGAGLGSVRASNWLVASLASLGLVGTVLFGAFLVSLARTVVSATASPPASASEAAILTQALMMGCVGLLLRALVVRATPDLGLLFFALAGMAAGMARSLELGAQTHAADGHAPPAAPAPRLRPAGAARERVRP